MILKAAYKHTHAETSSWPTISYFVITRLASGQCLGFQWKTGLIPRKSRNTRDDSTTLPHQCRTRNDSLKALHQNSNKRCEVCVWFFLFFIFNSFFSIQKFIQRSRHCLIAVSERESIVFTLAQLGPLATMSISRRHAGTDMPATRNPGRGGVEARVV